MDIGISTNPTEYSIDIAVLARQAEDMGFESLWVAEHPVLPVHTDSRRPDGSEGKIPKEYADFADPFVALGRASAVTSRLKLGTGVCLLPERNPLLLAKQVATLDMYSGGRFIFGVGAGWLREETEIMGGDFEHRWAQTREAVLAMKDLWTKTKSEYHGQYYDFPPVYSFPRPAQRPHPPVLIGSHGRSVLQRVVAWGDGWIPYMVTPAHVREARATLNRLAQEAGRDASAIQVVIYDQPANRDLARRFEEARADRFVIRLATADEPNALAQLEQIAEVMLR